MTNINADTPSALEAALAQKEAENKNTLKASIEAHAVTPNPEASVADRELARARVIGQGMLDWNQYNSQAAVRANSFGIAAIVNKGVEMTKEAMADSKEDPSFKQSLTTDFLNGDAPDIPHSQRIDHLMTAPNRKIYDMRKEVLRARHRAMQTVSESSAAQNIGLTGVVAELIMPTKVVTKVAGLSVAKGFAGRAALAATANAVPQELLDAARASINDERRTVGDAAGSMALNGGLGVMLDGVRKVDMLAAKALVKKAPGAQSVAKAFDKAGVAVVGPVKDFLSKLVSKETGAARNGEAVTEEVVAGAASVEAKSTLKEGVNAADAKAVPEPVVAAPVSAEVKNPIKEAARANETARTVGDLSPESSPLLKAVEGSSVAAAVHAEGHIGDAGLDELVSPGRIRETVAAAQRHTRSQGPLAGSALAHELEGAIEARVGVSLPPGWLSTHSPADAGHILMQAKVSAAETAGTMSKIEITGLKERLAHLESRTLGGTRWIDNTQVPVVADAFAARAHPDLVGSKSVFTIGGRSYKPVFDSAVDNALFVLNRGGSAKVVSAAKALLKEALPELSEAQLKRLSKDGVHRAVRELAESVSPGERPIGREVPELRVPTYWADNIPRSESLKQVSVPVSLAGSVGLLTPGGKILIGAGLMASAGMASASDGTETTALALAPALLATLVAARGRIPAKALQDGMAEWRAGGYKKFGLLNPDVVTPDGAVYLETAGKVAYTHINPKFMKMERGLKIGYAPADTMGMDISNAANLMGDVLFMNAVGKMEEGVKGSVLVKPSADQIARIRSDISNGNVQRSLTDKFYEWQKASGMDVSDFNTAAPAEFKRIVQDTLRGMPAPHPLFDEAAKMVKKEMDEAIDYAQETAKRLGADSSNGSLLGKIGDIKKADNPNYMPREHMLEQRLDWEKKIGREGVLQVYTAAIAQKNPKLTSLEAMEKADEFIKTLDSKDLTDGFVVHGLADDLTPGSLLDRIPMNENMAEIAIKGVDGVEHMVSIRDFLNNDTLALLNNWFSTIHGITALGEAGARTGFDLTSKTGFDLFVSIMHAEGASEDAIKLAIGGRKYIIGQGNGEMWKHGSVAGNVMRKFMTIRYGRDFAFAQFGDLGNHVHPAELRKIMEAMPGIADMKAIMLNQGPIAGTLLHDIAQMSGLGLDHVVPVLRGSIDASGAVDSAGNAANMVLHKMMSANGMYTLMGGIQSMATSLSLVKLYRAAVHGEDLPEKAWKHLHVNGIDKQVFERLKPLLKAHTTAEDGVLTGIDYVAIKAADPEVYLNLQKLLHTVKQDAASEAAAIGQLNPLLTTELGRTLVQFQQAAIVSVQRSRRDVLNFDADVAMRWVMSFMFSAMGYAAKAGVASIGNPDEWEKRMDPHKWLAASFRGSSFSGVLPNISSAAMSLTPWEDPLSGASTTGRQSVNAPPIFDFLRSLKQTAKDASKAAFSDDVLTQQQALTGSRNFNPFIGLQPAIAWAANNLLPEKQTVHEPVPDPSKVQR